MADFRVVISDSETGKSRQVEISGNQAARLLGKVIGDVVDGEIVGLPGFKLKITGGTDRDGFPMRRDLPGSQRRRILVSRSVGFKPEKKGLRKRKTLRGNEISQDTGQINTLIVERGSKTVEEILDKKEGEEETAEKSEE